MDEDKKRNWDVWLAALAPVITVAGILVGVWQFNAGERNRVVLENELLTKKDEIEFHRKLWLEKLDTYRSIVTLAGKIAAATDSGHVDQKNFNVLISQLVAAYWGQSIFVEDSDVADALGDFYRAADSYRSGWSGTGQSKDSKPLKIKADRLAQACKASIARDAPPGGAGK
ncbi:hypothetical protein P0D69_43360 [Paraburkholderia sediminicola]|uniref:hypothetical protein n=1 Tax=Paraburkholderia TaxID=1822464 RepID=UPI001455DF8B|nr:hypothetical protein [Paraburkholderia aromaticivorans]